MSAGRTESTSLVVPELLQGQWTTAIISTFGANLTFFESRLMGQLAQVPLRIILADGQQLLRGLEEAARTGQRHRLANKAYVAAPIRHPHAAHAKVILLLGPTSGRLIAGSGNLSYDGYASPGELWHVYEYDDDQPEHLKQFTAARAFFDSLADRKHIDPPAIDLLQTAWGNSTWLPSEVPAQASLVNNFDRPLIAQLRDAASDPVLEMVVHAPFHDKDCAALDQLLTTFQPKRLRLLVTHATSAETTSIERILGADPSRTVELVDVVDEPSTYLHAKWVHLIHSKSETLLTGSANLSRSALLRTTAAGNIEAGIISAGARGAFDGIYAHVQRQPVTNLGSLGLSIHEVAPDDEAVIDGLVALWSRLDGNQLAVTFSAAVPLTSKFQLEDDAGDELEVVSVTIDDNMATFVLAKRSADRLAEGGRVVVYVDGDADQRSVMWPYHLRDLRHRLKIAGQREQLPRVGTLPDQDAELYDLLRELDQTLIIDREAAWRIASPGKTADDGGGGSDSGDVVRLDELDWERVRRDPRYRAYNPRGRAPGTAPTDIQVILAAIARRLGDLGISSPDTGSDDDDLAHEGDVGLDANDEATDDELEDELTRHRLPVSTRTRMAFDRFVRRYGDALSDSGFVDDLGPVVAVTNAVIFNHILSRLLEREAVSPRYALAALLATWQFLWGTCEEGGVTKGLDTETLDVVRTILKDSESRAETLRGLVSALGYEDAENVWTSLRNVTRYLLTDSEFALDAVLVSEAAGDPSMSLMVLDELTQLAEWYAERELFDFVLAGVGLPASAAGWRVESVRRAGRDYRSVTFIVHPPVEKLTVELMRDLLQRAAVATYFAGNDGDYIRVRLDGNGKSVAYWDEAAGEGVVMVDDEVEELDPIDPPWPVWSLRLDDVRSELDAAAPSQAEPA
ncbi:hypothetical protein [Rudaeicoccus suwonensis]|uniref:Uncharacterized protein n=1 Tax=Rudaeicoccus suwonensis TaxID=657409 RepID=A0A561E4D3_9MICO|nr:hypothetical protein [Rudaeicoccus suwonensis]TWE10475.1 hypothetical protein BKA23_2837 [Rudaeicoccus suwonensis]